MIRLKNEKEIKILREGGRRLAFVLNEVVKSAVPGVETSFLDDLAFSLIKEMGDEPAFLNYRPTGSRLAYPTSLCVSVNKEIVHGVPKKYILKDGDVVGLDLGLKHQGLFTDMAITVGIGEISKENKKLIAVAKKSLEVGIKSAKKGKKIGDISYAIQKYVEGEGFNVVQGLAGHGVGFAVHEDPFVPNYGKAGTGDKLVPGLVLAIEPMVTTGSGQIKLEKDGFTFSTKEGLVSAHFEKTIVITEDGPKILTKL